VRSVSNTADAARRTVDTGAPAAGAPVAVAILINMAWIAENPSNWAGARVGTGHCVVYVQRACGAPHTSQWRAGAKVRGHPSIAPGTAIATFNPNGRYGNHTDGRSHAAVFIDQDAGGIMVWDQWTGQPVHQRVIRFRGGQGKRVNDGDQFCIVEAVEAADTV
jgi:hypothetical protein